MNNCTTCLARGGWCSVPTAPAAPPNAPSRSNSSVRASPAKPPSPCRKNCRREPPAASDAAAAEPGSGRAGREEGLFDIGEGARVEQDTTESRAIVGFQQTHQDRPFGGGRRPSPDTLTCPFDLGARCRGSFLLEPHAKATRHRFDQAVVPLRE